MARIQGEGGVGMSVVEAEEVTEKKSLERLIGDLEDKEQWLIRQIVQNRLMLDKKKARLEEINEP
jgi:hypothetical protein